MHGIRAKARALAEMGIALKHAPRSARFLPSWFRSLRPGHGPLQDGLPWMSFAAIRWLEGYLGPTTSVFEYGMGGSTLFLARRVRRLVSVESDPRWFDMVSRAIRDEGRSNAELRFVPAVRTPAVQDIPYGPESYTGYDPDSAGCSFEAYIKTIDEYPDASFDLVVVDGFARPSAVRHAIPKIRPRGCLLLDDSDRLYAGPAIALLRAFPRRDFRSVAPFQRSLQQASAWQL